MIWAYHRLGIAAGRLPDLVCGGGKPPDIFGPKGIPGGPVQGGPELDPGKFLSFWGATSFYGLSLLFYF